MIVWDILEIALQPFYHFDLLSREKNLIHAVSRKDQREPYAFSLALHTGENQADIVTNRRHLMQELPLSGEEVIVIAKQTHSNNISVIEKREMRGWVDMQDAVENCDALVTAQRGVILAILTADCVPVLLYDPVKSIVAAIHAGWRGTEAGIVAETVAVMQRRFGSKASDILAGIAPSIGKCCYEVGADVAMHFEAYPEAVERRGGKYMLDLPEVNREQLISKGVLDEKIEMSGICTSCKSDQYFSYRKECGCSGRFMTIIGMKS